MGIYGKNSIIWDHNYQTAEHLAQFGYLPSPNFRIPAHNVKENELYYNPPRMIKLRVLLIFY